MTLVYADRVQETFTTTGTGTISLGGPVVGYQAFSAALSDTNTCYYTATDGTNWETGLATYSAAGDTLARTTVYESSNDNSLVNWASGVKNIWLDLPAIAISSFTGGITLGTTSVTGGAAGQILYDTGGGIGEYQVSGTGEVAMTNSPALVTPDLGTPSAGNLSNCTGIPGSLMTALGVGSIILGSYNAGGGSIAAGHTTAASNITVQRYFSGNFVSSGDTITGVWQCLQQMSLNYIGLWQRIS